MKKIVLLAFASVLLLSMLAATDLGVTVKAEPKTIYVDAGNVDDPLEDGSLNHPFDKIQEGIGAAVPGDTVFVYGGTYYESNIALDKDNLSLIGENKNNTVIDGMNYGWILIITARDVTVTGFTIQESSIGTAGIFLNHATESKISNNIIKNHDSGIYSVYSNGNVIENNWVANNNEGIILSIVCKENKIRGNNVTGNTLFAGIDLTNRAHDNEIENNNIVQNTYGIWISFENNSIFGNQIVNNDVGIYEDLDIGPAQGYRIFHNNFINNTIQVNIHNSTNIWDDGYPSGGNYWSDFAGVDEYEGNNQDQLGSDGIADTPFALNDNNTDRFPLMGPLNTFDVGTWNGMSCEVHVVSNSTISDFQLNLTQRIISFTTTGPNNSLGFSRVTIPNIIVQNLWQGRYKVLIDGKPPLTIGKWTNEIFTYMYFTYLHSENETTIVLKVSPQHPLWVEWWFWTIVIAGSMVVMAGAIYFLKKKERKSSTV